MEGFFGQHKFLVFLDIVLGILTFLSTSFLKIINIPFKMAGKVVSFLPGGVFDKIGSLVGGVGTGPIASFLISPIKIAFFAVTAILVILFLIRLFKSILSKIRSRKQNATVVQNVPYDPNMANNSNNCDNYHVNQMNKF